MITYTFTRPATVTDQQLLDLYRSVDWLAYLQHPDNTLAAFAHSTVMWALDRGELVGVIRGITDQHTILYIQDILVRPDHQGQRIGTQLVQQFLQHYASIGQTVLITDPEDKTLAFYQSLKFLEITPQTYGRAFVLERRF